MPLTVLSNNMVTSGPHKPFYIGHWSFLLISSGSKHIQTNSRALLRQLNFPWKSGHSSGLLPRIVLLVSELGIIYFFDIWTEVWSCYIGCKQYILCMEFRVLGIVRIILNNSTRKICQKQYKCCIRNNIKTISSWISSCPKSTIRQ